VCGLAASTCPLDTLPCVLVVLSSSSMYQETFNTGNVEGMSYEDKMAARRRSQQIKQVRGCASHLASMLCKIPATWPSDHPLSLNPYTRPVHLCIAQARQRQAHKPLSHPLRICVCATTRWGMTRWITAPP
jgi:hypothetical protein